MLVMLSTNRCVATSVSFAVMSRPTDMTCEPSAEKAVPSTQSECAPCCSVCLPVNESNTRTLLSGQPTAMSFPSGDQLAPYTVS